MTNIIGPRITKARKRKGYSQKKLAGLSGVTEASLSRYENGLREPKPSTLNKIADVLEVTTDYLLGRTDIVQGVVMDKKNLGVAKKLDKEYMNIAIRMQMHDVDPDKMNKLVDVFVEVE